MWWDSGGGGGGKGYRCWRTDGRLVGEVTMVGGMVVGGREMVGLSVVVFVVV